MARTLGTQEIPLKDLVNDPTNVRRHTTVVGELEQSIRQYGIIEPLVVRQRAGKYSVVIGSRRLAAAKALGLSTVPAIIKELSDEEALIQSAVENIQRETLDADDEMAVVAALQKIHPEVAAIARILDRPRTWVEDRITVKSFITDYKEASAKRPGAAPREIQIPRDVKKVAGIVRTAERIYKEPTKRAALVEALKDKPRETVQRVVREMREIAEAEPEVMARRPVKESISKAMDRERLPIEMVFSTTVTRGLKKAASDRDVSIEDIVEMAVADWLRRNRFL